MKPERIISIQFKILAISVAVFILFAAAFILGDFFRVEKYLKEDYLNDTAANIALMEMSFSEESDFSNEAKLQVTVEKFAKKFPEILKANIYGYKDGRYAVLASTDKEKIGKDADNEDIIPIFSGKNEIIERPDAAIEFLIPLSFEEKPVLSAGVYFPSSFLNGKILAARLWNGMILSIGFFTFLLFSLFLMNFIIIRPVYRIVRDLEEISEKGDLNRKIEINTSDEFGYLAKTVNKFTAQMTVLDDLKYNFLKAVSHQLRTPLSSLRWGLELLSAGKFGGLNEKQKDFFNLLLESNNAIVRIVDNMILASNLEEKSVVLNKTSVHLGNLMGFAIIEVESAIKLKKINLTVDAGEIPALSVDSEKILEILKNLLRNAVYYNKEGGKITVKAGVSGKEAVVSVSDSGIGIPEADQDKIFMKFYRTKEAWGIVQNASGLGLFISKKIVELHGGRMWFESKLGQGSTFFFALPIKKTEVLA